MEKQVLPNDVLPSLPVRKENKQQPQQPKLIMILSPRIRKYCATIRLDRKLVASRASIPRLFATIVAVCVVAYLIWLPIAYLLGAVHILLSTRGQPVLLLPAGADAVKHFAGSQECNILQSDIYLAPASPNPKLSPFCSNRATLLEALSNGGRYGFDEPYVGKGCTYRWLSTPETCMVLERFNAIVFVGDDIARSIYLAFNILLREDLVFGGLQGWSMNDRDRANCRCDSQFLDVCLAYGIESGDDIQNGREGNGAGSPYFCERIPHVYIPVDTVPASSASVNVFKDYTYFKPNPWQPSPIIFSFGHASSFDIEMTTRALEEWLSLASLAERNIPLLFLSPPAIGAADTNTAVWQFHQRMSTTTKHKHVDVLGLYNLTLQASTPDGKHFGERVALVEAMMIINWLSKLETS